MISIIIPTYNRAGILKKCLEALGKQNYKNFEIIIVDDGSKDNTKNIVSSFKKKIKIKYIYQKHKQQGSARNKGIKIAKGEIVAFMGDDIIPEKEWLYEHAKIHKKNRDVAVLGLTLWHPLLKVNDFMRYLAPNGPQFNYGLIKDKNNCGWRFFWASNISLPKKFLLKEKFDENFRGWGYEDLELGYRLGKKGLKVVFNEKALAYHYHYYDDPKAFFKKQENASKSALYFIKKYPELKKELIDKNKLKIGHKLLLILFFILPSLKRIKKFEILYWKAKRRYYFNLSIDRIFQKTQKLNNFSF